MDDFECSLCHDDREPLWFDPEWRITSAASEGYPHYYLVVSQRHVAELTDLEDRVRLRGNEIVASVERALRDELRPSKINVASLGNAVPHVHWHVVARFDNDPTFPGSIWSPAIRDTAEQSELSAVGGENVRRAIRDAMRAGGM